MAIYYHSINAFAEAVRVGLTVESFDHGSFSIARNSFHILFVHPKLVSVFYTYFTLDEETLHVIFK